MDFAMVQSISGARQVFFLAKIINLGNRLRITDCDPKIGKNFFNACQQFNELGLPVHIPFVPCEYQWKKKYIEFYMKMIYILRSI